MERSATAARAWVAGECLGVSAAFAAALLIAPLVGGVALRPALALAAMAVAALAVAYGRALTPLLGLSAAVPHYLVWVVIGFGAASLVHLTVTAALNLGVWPALAADVAGALAVTAVRAVLDTTSRRHTAFALSVSPPFAPPAGPVALATQMAVLIAAAAVASLWAREVITAVPHTLATGVFPAWQDYFLHASEITYLRDYPSFERHSQYLAAVPQPLYHRGSYALSSVFSALSGLPSLITATTFWLPTGLLLCITATYTFGAAMGGGLGGLAAVAAVFLAPDASGYGFHNRFLSFHWLLQMAGGSSYAVALVLVALTRVVTALPSEHTRALLVEKAPQVLGLVGVDARERRGGHRGAAKEHVAVQVDLVGRAGPLVADQRGEAARLVVALGGGDHFAPGGHVHLRQVEQFVQAAVVRGVVGDLHQRLEGIRRIGAGEELGQRVP